MTSGNAPAGATNPANPASPATTTCPLCGKPVIADPLGLLECSCSWGGPGDPLEAVRGISRLVTRIDRNMANAQARRDLQRLATKGDTANHLSMLYLAVL